MVEKIFITRWNGWRQFARDFAVIQFGFLLFGLAINIMVQANLGTSPWVVLEKALTLHFPITLGQATIVVALIITLLDVLLKQPLGWGTLANMLSIGLWVDALRPLVPMVHDNLWLQIPYLLLGVLIMGFATAIYVGVNAGAGPRDSLMLAVSQLAKISVRRARMFLEVGVVLVGWLLGGPVGLGTLIFALAIGPAVQLAFRLLRVDPPQRVVAEGELPG
ncbi:MAG: YczE/YyaS/YitT family protein [Anaerolineales bacterium]